MTAPSILKVPSCAIKKYIVNELGHPHVSIELSDDQLNDIIRVAGDFVASYFRNEEKLAFFYTQPLVSSYPLPEDAWIVNEVLWDPFSPLLDSTFNLDYQLLNSGIFGQFHTQILDVHLVRSYQKIASKILSRTGRWEITGEVEGNKADDSLDASSQRIRMYPTPKGAFPVMIKYCPSINSFRRPDSRYMCYKLMVAEAKIRVGHARRKVASFPGPDGAAINLDGDAMLKEGIEERDKIMEEILHYTAPIPPMIF